MNKKLFSIISLKTSILLPLGIVLVTLISSFTYGYLHQEEMYTHKHIGDQFISAKHLFDAGIQIETEKLSATLTSITFDSKLKHAMISGDRDALLKQSSTLFNTLHDKYQITHFYFHRPDRVNFLRVHKSFSINLNHMNQLVGNQISIGDQNVPVGQTYKKALLKALNL